jgi:hypothetical protein
MELVWGFEPTPSQSVSTVKQVAGSVDAVAVEVPVPKVPGPPFYF